MDGEAEGQALGSWRLASVVVEGVKVGSRRKREPGSGWGQVEEGRERLSPTSDLSRACGEKQAQQAMSWMTDEVLVLALWVPLPTLVSSSVQGRGSPLWQLGVPRPTRWPRAQVAPRLRDPEG